MAKPKSPNQSNTSHSCSTKRCLITGAGQLGNALAIELLAQGHVVTVIDKNDDCKVALSELRNAKLRFETIDICNSIAVENLVQEFSPDAVFHTAAVMEPQFERSVFDGAQVNITASLNLIDCAVKNRVKTFIFASSLAVYDFADPHSQISEDGPFTPLADYGHAKLFVESWLQRSTQGTGTIGHILRYVGLVGIGLHYGGAWCSRMIQDTLVALLDGDAPDKSLALLRSLGDNEYLHVKDAASATLLVAQQEDPVLTNVGNGVVIKQREFTRAICKAFSLPEFGVSYASPNEVPYYRKRLYPIKCSNDLREMGYTPQFVSAEAIVLKLVEELRQFRETSW